MTDKKPIYEAPVVINLGNLATGAGAVCAKGKGQISCSRGQKAGGASISVCGKGASPSGGVCSKGKKA